MTATTIPLDVLHAHVLPKIDAEDLRRLASGSSSTVVRTVVLPMAPFARRDATVMVLAEQAARHMPPADIPSYIHTIMPYGPCTVPGDSRALWTAVVSRKDPAIVDAFVGDCGWCRRLAALAAIETNSTDMLKTIIDTNDMGHAPLCLVLHAISLGRAYQAEVNILLQHIEADPHFYIGEFQALAAGIEETLGDVWAPPSTIETLSETCQQAYNKKHSRWTVLQLRRLQKAMCMPGLVRFVMDVVAIADGIRSNIEWQETDTDYD